MQRSFDWQYFLRFVVIYLVLFYANQLFWGIVDPRNFYIPFADKYLNYIRLLIGSILGFSNQVIHLFGYNTVVDGLYLFKPGSTTLYMDQPCIGFGVMFFWIAFIWAAQSKSTMRFKIKWSLIGLLSIWVINCTRVVLLFFALEKQWALARFDAHDMFNYASYVAIILLIWAANANSEKVQTDSNYNRSPELNPAP